MFNEIPLPQKEEFYSNLNMEDIIDADYMHAKNFRQMCLKMYQVDPVKTFFSPGLTLQAS